MFIQRVPVAKEPETLDGYHNAARQSLTRFRFQQKANNGPGPSVKFQCHLAVQIYILFCLDSRLTLLHCSIYDDRRSPIHK